jgi:hypothetical protein
MYTAAVLAVLLLLVVAFWGYGRTIRKLCAPGVPTDAGTTACLGLAGYLAACGIIELTASASAALLVGIIAFGAVLGAWWIWRDADLRRPWPRLSGWRLSGWSLLIPLLAVGLAFLANVAWWHFRNIDDTQGYLVLPLRLLQTGSTGLDPFLFRRVEAGLGGYAYLYALPLALFEFPTAHIADLGLGSVLLALLVGRHAVDVAPHNTRVLAAALALALAVVVFVPEINLAPDVPAIAMVYAAIRQARRLSFLGAVPSGAVSLGTVPLGTVPLGAVPRGAVPLGAVPRGAVPQGAVPPGTVPLGAVPRGAVPRGAVPLGEHISFGLLLFGLVCLRTTYLVPAVAVAASLYLALLWSHRDWRVVSGALAAFLVVAVLSVPWMVVLQRIAGTPYYPLLGFGTMSHAEVAAFAAPPILVKNVGRILFCYALAALGLWTVIRARATARFDTVRLEAFLCLLAPLLLALSLLAQTKYTIFGWRYGYVAVVPLPLYLFVELLGAPAALQWRRTLLPACLALFAIALVHNESWHPDTVASGQLYVWGVGQPYNVYAQEDATRDRAKLRAAMLAVQDAVPAGQLLLVRLDMPFLLDFRRNPIWVMDHPGLCGPPPGVPPTATTAAWTSYLEAAGVRFVAYAYGNEAGEPVRLDQDFLRNNGPSYYQEQIASAAAAVQTVLRTLPASGQVLYDDGTRYVMRLNERPVAQGTGITDVNASMGVNAPPGVNASTGR